MLDENQRRQTDKSIWNEATAAWPERGLQSGPQISPHVCRANSKFSTFSLDYFENYRCSTHVKQGAGDFYPLQQGGNILDMIPLFLLIWILFRYLAALINFAKYFLKILYHFWVSFCEVKSWPISDIIVPFSMICHCHGLRNYCEYRFSINAHSLDWQFRVYWSIDSSITDATSKICA